MQRVVDDTLRAKLADVAQTQEALVHPLEQRLSAAEEMLAEEQWNALASRLARLETHLSSGGAIDAGEVVSGFTEIPAQLDTLRDTLEGRCAALEFKVSNLADRMSAAVESAASGMGVGEVDAGTADRMAAVEAEAAALEAALRALPDASTVAQLQVTLDSLANSVQQQAGQQERELVELRMQVSALEALLASPSSPLTVSPPSPPAQAPPTPPPPSHKPAITREEVSFAPTVVPEEDPSVLETDSRPGLGRRVFVGKEVLLQGFHWDSSKHNWYQIVRERLGDVQSAGFTGVWLPPPSDSIAPQGYMPRDLYNLNSAYGSESELRGLVSEMKERGLCPIADIVINHRCATHRGAGGKWNRWEGVRMDWGEWAICSNNPEFSGQGRSKQGDDFTASPNIDHTNERVRTDLKEWLGWLRNDIGFEGLRFDFVKGYAGNWVGDYVRSSEPDFAVGEFWDTLAYSHGTPEYDQHAHRQRCVDWIDATGGVATAFDFTTKGVLQEACGSGEYWRLVDREGRPPGVIGLWPSRAVTFIDNHDTGSTQAHWPFPAHKVGQGYAYILTHPGTPSVLWDHYFDWGDELREQIDALIEVRREANITSRSPVKVLNASGEYYAAEIGGRVAVKLGHGDWKPSGDWRHVRAGDGWSVWSKV